MLVVPCVCFLHFYHFRSQRNFPFNFFISGIDKVFGTECHTKQVYEEGAKEIALAAVSGINCELSSSFQISNLLYSSSARFGKFFSHYQNVYPASIFAYGQTSSGKTYTMRGITEYAVADIYEYIDQVISTKKQYKLLSLFYCICMEIGSFRRTGKAVYMKHPPIP